jgi:hypothetical protein
LAQVLALANVLGFKKADGVILTGCTVSQIERNTEMSATGSETEVAQITGLPITLQSAHLML